MSAKNKLPQANVTVYMPDFYGGEQLDFAMIKAGKGDLEGFKARNSRAIREPEVFAFVKELRSNGFTKLGAVGYCWGGWAVLRLAAEKMVEAVICAHPSSITNDDFDAVETPIMFLAPEKDRMFSDELKLYAFNKLVLEKKSRSVEWAHFPGVAHGCLTKGDENVAGEREAMVKAKDRSVAWWKEWLL